MRYQGIQFWPEDGGCKTQQQKQLVHDFTFYLLLSSVKFSHSFSYSLSIMHDDLLTKLHHTKKRANSKYDKSNVSSKSQIKKLSDTFYEN